MYSKHHFVISLAVGMLWTVVTGVPPTAAGPILAYGGVVGVLIDLDHFLIARFTSGNWRALRFCIANPIAVFGDQSRIFEPGEVGELPRLLSHALIGGVSVGAIYPFDVGLAVFTALVVYVHLVSDLVWDVRRHWIGDA